MIEIYQCNKASKCSWSCSCKQPHTKNHICDIQCRRGIELGDPASCVTVDAKVTVKVKS